MPPYTQTRVHDAVPYTLQPKLEQLEIMMQYPTPEKNQTRVHDAVHQPQTLKH